MSRPRYAYADGATVKPRKQGNPKRGYTSWALTVPSTIAQAIPNLERLEFVPEVTTAGILYRPVALSSEPPSDWTGASNQDTKGEA